MNAKCGGRVLETVAGYKSKETYGQTRGLSNLEIKHVGKLAIIDALLKAVKAFSLAFVAYILQNS